jgi:hypothetical protein
LIQSCNQQDIVTNVDGEIGELSISFTNGADFGEISPEILYQKTITLKNSGSHPVTEIAMDGPRDILIYKGGSYPGTGGTCSGSLAPGETCTIVLEFYTEENLIFSSDINFSFNDGLLKSNKKFSINANAAYTGNFLFAQGTYNNPQDVEDNTTTLIRFDQVSIGDFDTQTVSFLNNGNRNISFPVAQELPLGVEYSGGDFPGDSGTCTTTIRPREVCLISFSFTSLTEGQQTLPSVLNFYNGLTSDTQSISFFTNTVDERANIIVAGTGTINLGKIASSFTKTSLISLFNPTVLEATALSMVLSNNMGGLSFIGGAYPGTNGTCGNTLSALSTCTIELQFSSTTLGPHSEDITLDFNDNHVISPMTVNQPLAIEATVVTPGNLALAVATSIPNTTPDNFGPQPLGATVNHIFSIENIGEHLTSQVQVELINNPSGVFQINAGGSCATTLSFLANAQKCTVRVKTLSSNVGLYSADLKISFDDGLGGGAINNSLILPLSVNYVEPSSLSYTPSSLVDFGDIINGTTSSILSITLQNTAQGNATSLVFDNAVLASSSFTIVGNTCGSSLNGSSSCTLQFQTSPTSINTEVKTLRLDYADLLGSSSLNLTLRRRSLSPANLSFRGQDDNPLANFSFSDSPVGKNSTQVLRIRNTGGFTATSIIPSFTGSAFSISDQGTCPALTNFSLGGGSYCDVEVTFNPSSLIAYNESLSIAYNDGTATTIVNLPVSGLGAASGLLIVQGAERFPASTMDLGTTVATIPTSTFFTIENTGTANATNFILGSISNNFSYGSNTCTGVINIGSTCQVEVIYNSAFQGTDTSIFDYTYDSPGTNKRFTFSITANALRPPDLRVLFFGPNQPSAYDFKKVPYLVSEDLYPITITNMGSAAADNFSLGIEQGLFTSFSYTTDCPEGGSLAGGATCRVRLSYSPEDLAIHNATLNVNYAGYGNEVLPIPVALQGEGVEPLANFTAWKEIYAATDSADGQIRLKWDTMVSTSGSVIVDGYKVYSSSSPLPTSLDLLAPFEVASIVGNTSLLRSYVMNNVLPDTIHYFAIRPTYLGTVMNSTTEVANLKIEMPPPHMALVHPYTVNQEICSTLGIPSENDKHLGCPYSSEGSVGGYVSFNRYLFVDRYEVSLDGALAPQVTPGETPQAYTNQLLAANACSNMNFTFQSSSITKRLIRRSEFLAAAAWDPALSSININNRENGLTANDCSLNQNSVNLTGSRSNCVSRYGIYDLIGNLWEWNSDQINSDIGWSSTVDPTNSEFFGVGMNGQLPGLLSTFSCFNPILGVAQNFDPGVCSNGVEISTHANLFSDDYFFPPLIPGIKPVRSGGGVGILGGFYDRKGGRFVADYNTEMTNTTPRTGARCVFTRPF